MKLRRATRQDEKSGLTAHLKRVRRNDRLMQEAVIAQHERLTRRARWLQGRALAAKVNSNERDRQLAEYAVVNHLMRTLEGENPAVHA